MSQNKSVEEVVREARMAFYKRHAKQQYPKSLVTILDSFETEFKQAIQQERQTSQEREREIVEELKREHREEKNRMYEAFGQLSPAERHDCAMRALSNPNKD